MTIISIITIFLKSSYYLFYYSKLRNSVIIIGMSSERKIKT